MSELEEAAAAAEALWQQHGAIHEPLRLALKGLVGALEGATGLPPSPGADRLISTFLDFAEQHADDIVKAATAKTEALLAETHRNEIAAALPPPEPDPVVPMLLTADALTVESWLKSANDTAVGAALDDILDADLQKEWAARLLGWARKDGNTAQVLAAIQARLVPANPATVPLHAQQPPPASASDVPVGRDAATALPPDGPLEAIEAWIGDSEARARQAFDAELAKANPTPEILAWLTDLVDKDKATPPTPSK